MQSQQAPERTVIQFAPPPQEEGSSDQEVRERYGGKRGLHLLLMHAVNRIVFQVVYADFYMRWYE